MRGGDSAYVPTTTVYSETDEIVQPQAGVLASAFLGDARRVGVTNVDIQSVCGLGGAGGLVTHEGVLYNALAWALVVDALTHPGPAKLARIDTREVCKQLAAPGLDVGDVMATEDILVVALLAIIAYPLKTVSEPLIKPYALIQA